MSSIDFLTRQAGKNLQQRAVNVAQAGIPNAAIDVSTDTNALVEGVDKISTDLMIAKALAQKYGPVWNGIRTASRYAPRLVGTAFRVAPPTAAAANLYALGSALHDLMQDSEFRKGNDTFNVFTTRGDYGN